MVRQGKREALMLIVGDIAVLFVSLWLTLLVRYQEPPQNDLFYLHIGPFLLIFGVCIMIHFIAGLYEKQSLFRKRRLPSRILSAQAANAAIAIAFFYLIPFFEISPKVVLFIYVVISFALLFFWRMVIFPQFAPRHRHPAILIASGQEMARLQQEINNNSRYGLRFVATIDLDQVPASELESAIAQKIAAENVHIVVIDLSHEKIKVVLPNLYSLIFSKIVFASFQKLYEEVFDQIPLSVITQSWFLENVSLRPKRVYDFLKRIMDIVISLVLFIISIPIYAVVYALIKLDDGGAIFIDQERVGQGEKMIRIKKFRTMTSNDQGEYSTAKATENKVTRVGNFLRQSRIDELPQLLNILKGDVSLIGPRPELPALVALYEKEIPYYNIRHLLKPGLSGWAQIYHVNHPHHGLEVQATEEKLSYDLFYVKNRSFILDIIIALTTVRTLLSRSGK